MKGFDCEEWALVHLVKYVQKPLKVIFLIMKHSSF